MIKEIDHLGTSLTFTSSVPYNIDILTTLIPNNIAMLAKSQQPRVYHSCFLNSPHL